MMIQFPITKLLARVNVLGLGSRTTTAPTIRRSGSKFFRLDQAHELSTVQLPSLPAPTRRVFFLHTPKTGGTAITQQAGLLYAEKNIQPWSTSLSDLLPNTQHDNAWQARQQFWQELDWLELKLLAREHTDFWTWLELQKHHPHLQNSLTFTIFREPIARSYSILQHRRRESIAAITLAHQQGFLSNSERDAAVRYTQTARDLSDEILLKVSDPGIQQSLRADIYNRMTRSLMVERTSPSWECSYSDLRSAQNTVEQFDFVGVQEDLLGSYRKLCYHLNVLMPPTILEANRGGYQKKLTPQSQALFADFNQVDQQLYRHAQARHEAELRELPTPVQHNQRWAETQGLAPYRAGLEIRMSDYIPGWGWHCREGGVGDVPYMCWTTETAVLYLPVIMNQRYQLQIDTHGAMLPELLTNSVCRINGHTLTFQAKEVGSGVTRLTAKIDANMGQSQAWSPVEIRVPATLSHEELQPGCGDHRQKGLLVEKVRLLAVS